MDSSDIAPNGCALPDAFHRRQERNPLLPPFFHNHPPDKGKENEYVKTNICRFAKYEYKLCAESGQILSFDCEIDRD